MVPIRLPASGIHHDQRKNHEGRYSGNKSGNKIENGEHWRSDHAIRWRWGTSVQYITIPIGWTNINSSTNRFPRSNNLPSAHHIKFSIRRENPSHCRKTGGTLRTIQYESTSQVLQDLCSLSIINCAALAMSIPVFLIFPFSQTFSTIHVFSLQWQAPCGKSFWAIFWLTFSQGNCTFRCTSCINVPPLWGTKRFNYNTFAPLGCFFS